MILTIELVPQTSWYSNVRSNVPQADWDIIRYKVYDAAGRKCEICGGRGPRHPVECHEVWEYDDDNNIQRLARMIALCPACHQVKHIGRAAAVGKLDEARQHLMIVNEWDRQQASSYIQEQLVKWRFRSLYNWTLDLEVLKEYIDCKDTKHLCMHTGKVEDAW